MEKEIIKKLAAKFNATPEEERKDAIECMAEKAGVAPWELADALKKEGCAIKHQWFAVARKKALAAAGGPALQQASSAYLKQIIQEQDRQLREKKAQCDRLKEELTEKDAELEGYRQAEDDRAKLKSSIDFLNEKIRYYKEQVELKEREIDELRSENAEMSQQIDLLYKGAAALKAETEEPPEEKTQHFEMEPVREYPSSRVPGGELELSDVLNDFCRNLGGVEAYLCGRVLEALWCWRLAGSDALRVLGGLVSELIEMELEKEEAARCSL